MSTTNVATPQTPTKKKYPPIQPDWISKTLAGCILGFLLALALSGIFAWHGPGGIDAPDKSQFNMWIVPPIWLTVFSLVYFFRSGLRAWLWLGGATVAAFAIIFLTRHLMGTL